ncbi:MAG: CoA transferase, partial [Actinomycetota bacterium]|nr:CoA transferase [Actinomycetota bacterium]
VIASASVAPESRQARFGSGHPSIVPYSAFEGSDGWVVLGAVNEDMWSRLCGALELEHMVQDVRCAGNEARVHNRAFVESLIADAVRNQTVAEVTRRLGQHGVLVAPVKTASEAIRDPQVEVLGLLDTIDGVHFSRTPLAQFNPAGLGRAPALGEHSSEVLTAFGCSAERLADLIGSGVVQGAERVRAEREGQPTDVARHANT